MSSLKNKISSILPDSQSGYTSYTDETELRRQEAQKAEEQATKNRDGVELARLKRVAKANIAKAEGPTSKKKPSAKEVEEAKKALETIEKIDAQRAEPLDVVKVASNAMKHGEKVSPTDLKEAIALQGTTRKEIELLFKALGVNTSIQLTKADTQNIVACLLTCNETQLNALMSNKKVPIAAKVIIKRLLDDAKVGNIETVERLWDRIFGKQGLIQGLADNQPMQTQGLIPNVPVSREAYILIRDTLIK